MTGDRPLSFVIKPPAEPALAIDRQRRLRRIDRRYGIERLHSTVLPLWDDREVSEARLDELTRAATSLCAEPFPVAFDTLDRNALVGAAATRGLRAFRKNLVRHLIALGFRVPDYASRPHVSLVYGTDATRKIAIPPIGWQVEEFLLIRSIHGEGRHELLGRWPLIARQRSFVF